MSETSTTDENDQSGDSAASTTTADTTDSTSTDTQTAASDNLDENTSKSTDSSDDGDKSTEEDKSEEAPASPKLDADLDDWIGTKGFPKPETDVQRAAYQAQRDEQREFTRTRQADKSAKDAKELGDEVHKTQSDIKVDDDDDLDPLEKRVKANEDAFQQERTTRLQSEFYSSNSVTPEQHKVILEVYKEKVSTPASDEGKQRAFEIWSDPNALTDLLDLANARIAKGSDTGAVADEAARKEREKIARESQANSPGRGAKSTTSGTKTEDQERLERFSNWD